MVKPVGAYLAYHRGRKMGRAMPESLLAIVRAGADVVITSFALAAAAAAAALRLRQGY